MTKKNCRSVKAEQVVQEGRRTSVGVISIRGKRIIFIGPDCSGKSTTAALVGQALGSKVYGHRRIKNPLTAVSKVISEPSVSSEVKKDIIYDQWMFPVDVIYQRCLGSKPSPLEGIHDELAYHYKAYGYVFVYITASEEEISKRYDVRGDELWEKHQILSVRGSYEHYWQENQREGHHNMIRVDSTGKTPTEVANEVLLELQKHYGEVDING